MRKFRLSESKAMLASALQSGRTNGRRPKGKSNFDRRSKTKLLSLLGLLLMAVAQGAWAQTLSTDGSGAYTIGSKADWETFCTDVNGGTTYEGKTVILTADVSGITTRTYNDLGKPFSGTFDGQGHTLNLNINVATADATSAPFGYISGATIKNLHITGSETTAGMRIASIAGFAANSTITNCWSEVALSSSKSGDIDGGAIVARTESGTTVTLNGCVFTGSITYSNAGGYEGGGMVGWRKGTVVLNNCVFAPSAVTVTKYSGHQMFVGNGGGTLNNCYYNDVAAATSLTVQGKQMRSITSGSDGVTISGLGTATATYDISSITAYSKGVKYDGVYYAGNGDAVSLTLSHADKTGYTFNQYTATGGGTLGAQTETSATLTMTDADQTISAAWTVNQYTITFDTDGGSAIDAITQDYGTAVTAPANPTKTGYTFVGWDKTIPTTMPAENMTIRATWTENTATLTDASDLSALSAYAGKTCTVTYTRSFTASKPSTVCLPFAYTKKTGEKFYTFTGITKNGSEYEATMTEYSGDNLVANTPYLFVPSSTGSVDFSGTYEIPVDLTAGETTSGDWKFIGTYSSLTYGTAPFSGYVYGFAATTIGDVQQGQFVRGTTGASIAPMRCYLTYNDGAEYSGARAITRNATATDELPQTIIVRLVGSNGNTTAIGTLDTRTGEVVLDEWYTLDGTRLSGQPTRKGIYINKGKKVVIK